ncbi:L-tyrosine/L-tryptophan isonitrile synthase family protein [candidate division WWE3 bacterium]|uniref:L-tyrosine/L-tryptophan isonitrile synthase family protein n=1 Tax=candidate division WWE3 bacterium TaxID=2053526 RepID=A0A955LHJ0_UNCKA|nr:L-tyrosine/L-tryptophan isonitrile synthase family protein [candidate division WWE3 bacterium]
MATTVKANPYVFPYVPFKDLSQKHISDNITSHETITWDELRSLVSKIESPTPNILGETMADKILSVYLDENYRFGPEENVENNRDKWTTKLNFFIDQNKPIEFTILGFPFKIPVPLKTNRLLPDMGEILALHRLQTVMGFVSSIYGPGAHVTLFTEGAFGQFTGVSKENWDAYREFLEQAIKELHFDKVIISDLYEMEASVDNFSELHQQKVASLKELYEKQDEAFLKKYEGTFSSVYRIVNPDTEDTEVLMDVYNDDLSDEDISPEALQVRKDIRTKTHESIFNYHAYLMVRDDLDYLQQVIPNSLTMSVSPKETRLGVIPTRKDIDKLPYHSVPVFSSETQLFTQEYLIDIIRDDSHTYTAVHLEGDTDPNPFFYQLN